MQITKQDFEERLGQIDHDIAQIVMKLTGGAILPTGNQVSNGLKEIKHAIVLRFMDILGGTKTC